MRSMHVLVVLLGIIALAWSQPTGRLISKNPTNPTSTPEGNVEEPVAVKKEESYGEHDETKQPYVEHDARKGGDEEEHDEKHVKKEKKGDEDHDKKEKKGDKKHNGKKGDDKKEHPVKKIP
jgi:hypothetical protein